MNRSISSLLLALATGPGLLLAADLDLSKLPPPAKQKGLTYAKDVRPIFEASCFGCHGSERAKGDLRLDSLEAILKGGEHGKVLTVGKSEKSDLVIAVSQLDEKLAMPPKPRQGRGPGGPGGPRGPGGPPGQGNSGSGKSGDGGNRPERPARAQGEGPGPGGPGGPGGGPGGRGGFGPPPKPLTAEQVGIIRAWIDAGAK